MRNTPPSTNRRSPIPKGNRAASPRSNTTAGRRISAVLLAAGTASRFGGGKQLAAIEGRRTLVQTALQALKGSKVDQVVVVVGDRSDEVRRGLGRKSLRFRVVLNKEFRSGLSSSLKTGLGALLKTSDAIVVALADQPMVTSRLINEIVARYLGTGSSVVASSAGGLVSPPVLFDKSLFSELMALEGDAGARSIITRHAPFERVEVERAVLLDVDTLSDMEEARRLARLKRKSATGSQRGPGGGGHALARPSSE